MPVSLFSTNSWYFCNKIVKAKYGSETRIKAVLTGFFKARSFEMITADASV